MNIDDGVRALSNNALTQANYNMVPYMTQIHRHIKDDSQSTTELGGLKQLYGGFDASMSDDKWVAWMYDNKPYDLKQLVKQHAVVAALVNAYDYMQHATASDYELQQAYTASELASLRAETARQAARQAVDKVKSSMTRQGIDWLTLVNGEVRVTKPINTDAAHHKAIVDACELFVRHLYDIGFDMPETVPDIYRMLVDMLEHNDKL